jgi:hypothetical protein
VNAIRSVFAVRRFISSVAACSRLIEKGDQFVCGPVEGVAFLIDVLRYGVRRFAPSTVQQPLAAPTRAAAGASAARFEARASLSASSHCQLFLIIGASSGLSMARSLSQLRALALLGCDHENVAGHLGHFLAAALGAARL